MQNAVRFVHVAALAAFASGCGSGDPEPPVVDAGPDDDLAFEGGTLLLDHCGYEVETRQFATAPEVGTPVVGDDPTPRHLHLGLSSDPSRSTVIQWRTVDETTLATTVQYGEGDSLDQTLEGFTFAYIAGFGSNGDRIRMHEAHLCGLRPDTEYSYRVGSVAEDGTEVWSDAHRFRTAPDPVAQPDAEVVFAVLGDTRDGFDIWQTMVTLLQSYSPDLVLFHGDAVTLGQLQDEWETFFDIGEPLLSEVPIVSAHGNHEANAVSYFSQFAMPGDEENYSLSYGPAHVTVLNDTPVEMSDIQGRTAQFLETDLQTADAPWKLIMHHRSIYSASTRHGSNVELGEAWLPIIDANAVDLVLAGHDHNYERTKPMRGNAAQPSPAEGTVYVVTGSAGATLYGAGEDFWTEISEETYSFVILRIRSGMLEMKAMREDDSQIDSLTIVKQAQ